MAEVTTVSPSAVTSPRPHFSVPTMCLLCGFSVGGLLAGACMSHFGQTADAAQVASNIAAMILWLTVPVALGLYFGGAIPDRIGMKPVLFAGAILLFGVSLVSFVLLPDPLAPSSILLAALGFSAAAIWLGIGAVVRKGVTPFSLGATAAIVDAAFAVGAALGVLCAAQLSGSAASFAVLVASVGAIFAGAIIPAADPVIRPIPFSPQGWWEHRNLVLGRDRILTRIICLGVVGFIATAYLMTVPHFLLMGGASGQGAVFVLALGVAAGGLAAAYLSFGAVEPALAVYGAAVGLPCSLLLAVVSPVPMVMILAGLGGFGVGLMLLPLTTSLWAEDADSCGLMIATGQTALCLGAATAAVFHLLLSAALGIHPVLLILFAAAGQLFVGLYLFKSLPDYFVRCTTRLLTRCTYRIRVEGMENVPEHGPALLVFNHTSFADGNLIVSVISRFVRFVVWKGHYKAAILRWAGEQSHCITVDGKGSAKELIRSLHKASDALGRGELVCIFPEGGITRIGNMTTFHRGFEKIMKHQPDVPIIPGYIDGMWGSIFSYSGQKFFRKRPKRTRYPVTIKLGKAMPAQSSTQEVSDRIRLLSTECFDARKDYALSLPSQFIRAAKRFSRRPCVTDANTPTLKYGEALMRAAILSRLLKRRLDEQQFTGVLVPPSVGAALTNVAVSFLNKIPVNLNYTVGLDVLNECVSRCGITQVITSRKFMEKVDLKPNAEIIYLEDLRKELKTTDKLFGLAARFLPSVVVDKLLLGLKLTPDDLATVIFSSGSTGVPKGVMLTHHNIAANLESVKQMVDFSEEESMMGVLPFFHSFGFTGTLWLPLYTGAAAVYHYSPLEPDVVSGLIKKYQCTFFVSTATFLRGHLRKSDKDDFASLKFIVCGAEKLPMQVADQFEKRFGIRPYEGYGCTELSPAVAACRPDFVNEDGPRQIAQKPGTIGRPMPGQAVRIVDPDSREPLSTGEAGLLLVKGPNVMKGYLNQPELTAEAIVDGWYNTGDIAKLDEEGFITITDRLSRFSKIGGEMVPHGKIEDKIHEILDTHDRLCAVVGVPDPRKGERLVVVHTELPIPVDDLWTRLKESGIPPLWLPAKQAFVKVDEIPILGTGKMDLSGVKEVACEKMGLQRAG